MRYMIQFVAGTRGILIEALAQTLQGVAVVHADDSTLVFDSSTPITKADDLPFANNVFVVLASTPRKSLAQSIRRLSAKVERIDFPSVKGGDRGFRIMAQIDGELAPIDRSVRNELERDIAIFTQSQVQAKGSCLEYWIVGRRNLYELLFCLRLPKRKHKEVRKGELAAELSRMLVAASRPDPGDTFLDPFGGHGAFVAARHESPFTSIYYSDIAFRSLAKHLPRALRSDRRVRLMAESALVLPSLRDGEIDVIVTDPPWGEFDQLPMGYPAFAGNMAASFDRILHPTTGRFVILSSRRRTGTVIESLTSHRFRIHASHGILVNGHPASVIVGSR